MTLDPITTEVIISRIRETTATMAHALFHSGYSPILRESQDGTAGLCDAMGRVIMVGHGVAIFQYLCDLLGLQFGSLRLFPYYTSVNVVRALGERRRVGSLADVAHLEARGG